MKQIKNNISGIEVLRYYRGIGKSMPWRMFSLFFVRTVTTILPLVTPYLLKQLVDTITSVQTPTEQVVSVALGIVWMILVVEILNQCGWRFFERVIITFEIGGMKKIYDQAFMGLHKQSYRFFINSFGGSLVKKINRLVGGYENIMDLIIFQIYPFLITMIVVFMVLFREDYRLGSIFLIWIVLFTVIQYPLFKRKHKYELHSHVIDSKTTGHLADTVTNHQTISVFGSLQREYTSFRKQSLERYSAKNKNRTMANRIFALNGVLMIIFIFCVLYSSVVLRGLGAIEVGTIILVLLYLYRIIEKVLGVSNIFKRFSNAIGQATEMLEILYQDIEIVDKENASELHVVHGSILFDKVNFSYDGSRTIFGGLDLDIKPGEKVALVGQSGAGKSSITKLLMRYFDIQGGSISVDGIDIRDVTQESLRAEMSLVPQEPILFHRSLRENISYGKPDATIEDIIEAATIARCHDFISQLEFGYDTMVGERGVKLSGGERQRVSIARAILENKKILILDEATSSLDSESEKMIQDAIQELMKDKTALVIAHRLSTIKEMDRILVFDQGRIVEQGKHEDLLNITNGIYKKLWTIQAT